MSITSKIKGLLEESKKPKVSKNVEDAVKGEISDMVDKGILIGDAITKFINSVESDMKRGRISKDDLADYKDSVEYAKYLKMALKKGDKKEFRGLGENKQIDETKDSDTIKWLSGILSKKDATITIKKNKVGDKIVYVNGQTSFNLDDHYGAAKDPVHALKRAYKASLKESVELNDSVKLGLGESLESHEDALNESSKAIELPYNKATRTGWTEWKDGTKQWFRKGLLHRDGGLPAYIGPDKTKAWYKDDKLHRLDGPAIEWFRGNRKEWYINGKEYDQDDFNKKVGKR